MSCKIYEKILKNSNDGFLKVNGYKNEDGEYFDFDIVDYNNSLIDILKKISKKDSFEKNTLKSFISENFKKNTAGIDKNDFMKSVEENEYQSINFFVKFCGKSLTVDGYYLEDYFIFIFKFNLEDGILKFSDILDESDSVYFWTKDINGNYITVNKKLLEAANLSDKSDLKGINFYDFWPIEQMEKIKNKEEVVIKNNTIKNFEEIFSDNDKQKILDFTIWPMLDSDSKPIGTVGIAVDDEYRTKFYSTLRENERNFKEITKYCDSAFFIRDEEQVIYMSPAYETIFEESYESFAKDVYKFNDYFKSEKNKQGILENYEFDKPNEGRLKAKLKNGKEKWIWYKFLPIYDEFGKAIKRIGILTDVTKNVELEEEKESIRLDFFANISHELRTPVNLVLSSIQVLKIRLDKLDPENRKYFSKYINIMQQNSFRLLKLINNLIDSTKIDSDSIQMNLINADIIGFIEDICFSVLHHIEEQNMKLVFDTDMEEEIVSFDPNFIERIMLNLLSNAIKFNKANGSIFVNINIKENDVVVEVRDEGIGIPEDKIDCIFDRFEQVRTKMKSEREGSGIGLYIVKSLIEMQGGTIKAISEEGKGSSMIFTLPRRIIENQKVENIQNKDNKINKVILEFSDIYY